MKQVKGQGVVSFLQRTQIDRQVANVQGAHGGCRPHEIEATHLVTVHIVKGSLTKFGCGVANDGQPRLVHGIIKRIESVHGRWQSVDGHDALKRKE